VEARLGRFLSMVRHQARGGRDAHLLTTERRAYLDEVAPGWYDDRTVAWQDNADALSMFLTEHHRLPHSRAADTSERHLRGWLSTQRSQASGGRDARLLTAARRKYLDRVAPGWLGERNATAWSKNADAVSAFHQAHGWWPSVGVPDALEKRIGQWLSTQRSQASGSRNAHLLTSVRHTYLDRVAPGWSDIHVRHDFEARVDALAAFHTAHGRKPNERSSDPVEARASKWLSKVRTQARGTWRAHLFTSAHRAYLDRVAAWWSDGLDRDEQSRANTDALAVFRATHGRKPNSKSSDPVEARLGRFLVRVRVQARGGQGADLLTPVRRAYLDQVTPWWSDGLDAHMSPHGDRQ
jgi:hypothetical protein